MFSTDGGFLTPVRGAMATWKVPLRESHAAWSRREALVVIENRGTFMGILMQRNLAERLVVNAITADLYKLVMDGTPKMRVLQRKQNPLSGGLLGALYHVANSNLLENFANLWTRRKARGSIGIQEGPP